MEKISILLTLFLLIGCSQEVIPEEDLIGGEWLASAGYVNGEITGEPNCYPFENGLEFIDKERVYVDTFERNFEYILSEVKEGIKITIDDVGRPGIYHYQIKMIDDGIVLQGRGFREGHNCYLERR